MKEKFGGMPQQPNVENWTQKDIERERDRITKELEELRNSENADSPEVSQKIKGLEERFEVMVSRLEEVIEDGSRDPSEHDEERSAGGEEEEEEGM